MKTDPHGRLQLTDVDLAPENAARIRASAVGILGKEERGFVSNQLVPAGAFAFAATYLFWAAQQASLIR